MVGGPPVNASHLEIACAIALGVVDDPNVTATLDALVIVDPRLRTSRIQTGWLTGADALVVATREYLTARRDVTLNGPTRSQSGWSAAAAVKARENAALRANAARASALQLLRQRGVLHQARLAGMTVRELN